MTAALVQEVDTVDDVPRTAPKSFPGGAKHAVELVGKAALFAIGIRVGIALLKRTGRVLFGCKGGQAAPAAVQQAPAAGDNQPVPVVLPAAQWKPVDAPPPALPSDYKQLVTLTLPCTVYSFYQHVISQQSDWLQRQHEQIDRQYNYVKRRWWPTPDNVSAYPEANDQNMLQKLGKSVFDLVFGAGGSAGFTRTVTFMAPPKPPNTSDASCVQRQQFAAFSDGTFAMATAMNMLNIPFKECFMVCTAWSVVPAPDPAAKSCTLTISAKVHFVKGTLVSGLIKATTFRDLNSFYKPLTASMATMLSAAPHVPEPAAAGSRGSWGSQRQAAVSRGAAGPVAASGSPAGGPSLAETMPLARQLRVLFVMLVLVGSLVHQVLLHRELHAMVEQLVSINDQLLLQD